MNTSSYRGRFAPTPSGPLHFGSLCTALGSYLDARHHQGAWLIRIEDVDSQRSKAAHQTSILHSLAAHGLQADEDIRIQSRHLQDYEQALRRLRPHLYPCDCHRKDWQAQAHMGALGKVYPQTCRQNGLGEMPPQRTLRLALPAQLCRFTDLHAGLCRYDLTTEIGDPVLKRRDGDIAYALAVVVDDALQNISHIVRGADLLAATCISRVLQELLGYPMPQTLHLPLALDAQGRKLSKQNHAAAIDDRQASANLLTALAFLHQDCSGLRSSDSPQHILARAAARWSRASLPDISL